MHLIQRWILIMNKYNTVKTADKIQLLVRLQTC